MLELPDFVSLPSASGVPTAGRTRTLCQVSLQKFPEALALETVNESELE